MEKVSWKYASGIWARLRFMSGLPASRMPTTVAIAAAKEPSRPLPIRVSSSPTPTRRLRARTLPMTISGASEPSRKRPSSTSPGRLETRFSASGSTPTIWTPKLRSALEARAKAEARGATVSRPRPARRSAASFSTSGTTWRIFCSSL